MGVAQSLQWDDTGAEYKRSHTAIWLALTLALLLHVVFILTPIIKQYKPPRSDLVSIAIEVKRPPPPPVPAESVRQRHESLSLPAQKPSQQAVKKDASKAQSTLENTPGPLPAEGLRQPEPGPGMSPELNRQQLQKLSPQILGSQFIREKPVTENIFGAPSHPDPQAERKEFHFPQRPNMLTMLDKPVPDLPFSYVPGLIEFAYDPGVKGEMQRFWDKITPEFGWRTNYGTKVRCKWVLVVAACGWGRSND